MRSRLTDFVRRSVYIVSCSFQASVVSLCALGTSFVGGSKLNVVGIEVLANAGWWREISDEFECCKLIQ